MEKNKKEGGNSFNCRHSGKTGKKKSYHKWNTIQEKIKNLIKNWNYSSILWKMDTEIKELMVLGEIYSLHISFSSVWVNNNRNLVPVIIRCVVDPDEPYLRWDEMIYGGQWSDPMGTSVVSTGDMRDRSATPKDLGIQQEPWPCKVVGQISGDFLQANLGGLRVPWRFACGICVLRWGLAALQKRFLQKKMQEPEAAFWEERMCLDVSVCKAGQGSWAQCWLWVKSGWWEKKWGKDEAELPLLPSNTWNVFQHLLRILRSKTHFDQNLGDALWCGYNFVQYKLYCAGSAKKKMILGGSRWQQTKWSHF